ncbi:ABC transporter permease [Vagococcus carniphilus]|uniref:ABC transporter permease n=1 Tax=Vagococcus carniphilus TaxID=218144 RepID=A0A430ASV8_9ENTE|nr:ABC transporter permease [Vagococcus carniphilus]MDT2815324.1 ABC transporter permease [Vagococcus carniphilus]MDT2831331.1 ABC transporter permease [Vagococcus carniphilus]MDT2832896.1 ABC transporter permease [Vagococcus carniphilus]MDT2840334.1 ABC transporter permease [Vagococcus carniphilus]MDT2848999.1 ABC transporter permease [Vagococcus carniphilus]
MVSMLAIIVSSALVYSAPLIFTALGGTFSERSGVVNVGLEGIMTVGAFSATVFNLSTAGTFGSATPWISMLFGGFVGVLFALIHAVATINLRADHIVSGTVINLMAPGLTVFLTKMMFDGHGQTDMIKQTFGKFSFPILKDIPVLGPIFFKDTSAPAYVAILVALLAYFIIFKTKFGLRLRSVGENPQAADTLGINVYGMKYAGVLISGFLGGMGGAVAVQSISGQFSISTIAGQGFISMAAMIFGKWNPISVMFAAIFFGLSQSLAVIGNLIPGIKELPAVYLQAAPYVLTVLVLVIFIGKSQGPKAIGKTYVKSK